ncbi:MAG TPA: hypothetical protein VM571_10410 [Noviherbaspirillum sp.]|nr:hypothetical protein [Noviherbaspirillum sp.]
MFENEGGITVRQGNVQDIGDILCLQERNHFSNLTASERTQGFVTTRLTNAQVENLLQEKGVFVATSKEKLVGYAFAGSWQFFSQWPIMSYMMTRLPHLIFGQCLINTENSFQYGPVCVDVEHRGSNVLKYLFDGVCVAFCELQPIGVTFINSVNQRSYTAHTRKLGLEVIDRFEFNDGVYYGLAFDSKMGFPRFHGHIR